MASESPSASWHPALMPNAHDAAPAEPAPIDATWATSSGAETPLQNIEFTTQEPESQESIEHVSQETGDNAWLSQDGDDGDAWLASEEPESQKPVVEQLYEAPPDAAEPQAIAPAPKGVISQHSSSPSFARTVSHDINFNDDDEGDWNLSRTDPDPFKFMPPSDRTNSFPPVPPMATSFETHGEHPLPSNQALDVLEEAERDVDIADEEYQSGVVQEFAQPHDGQDASPREPASSAFMGGDMSAQEDQVDARYEEGVPLISHTPDAHEAPVAGGFVNSFDDDGDDGDDFFGQVQDTNGEGFANGGAVQPLERKSTMQVMGSLGQDSFTRQSTLDETPEEEEEETKLDGAKPEFWEEPSQPEPQAEDLAAKWQEAFGGDDDDDDFLLEDNDGENKEVDPAAFFGSDDEGFLDDAEEPAPEPQPKISSRQSSVSNPYVPQNIAPQRSQSSYFPPASPAASQATPASIYNTPAPMAPYGTTSQYGAPPPPRPEMPQAQSFADKSKGGYSSPYDLPTDLVTTTVKPRKRTSMQQLPKAAPPPPVRSASASMYSAGPPSNAMSPPSSSHGPHPVAQQKPAPPAQKQNFFEDLPMMTKPRPSSRQSIRASSPAQHPPPMAHPHLPSPHMASATPQMPPSLSSQMVPPPGPVAGPPSVPTPSQQPARELPGVGNLVAPERVSPYAALQSPANHMPPPSTNTSRYSPAPPHGSGSHMAPPAAPSSRYSPAPPATKAHGSYGPIGTPGTSASMLPHQPRTSSPLTHCETNHGDLSQPERRASSSFEPRLARVSSLPPTREVEEEEDQFSPPRSLSGTHVPSHSIESRYNPVSPPKIARHTPPPPMYAAQMTLSPPKRISSPPKRISSYTPHAAPSAQPGFVPPPRAQTQSPSATFGHKAAARSADSTKRPSSAHSASPPVMTRPAPAAYAPTHVPTHSRGRSLTMNMVPPTDGREKDPLQRWKGVPVFAWGVGGTMVTSFPNSVPRYGIASSTPTMIRTPGEVKIRNVKEIDPLEERSAKFPGPLKGKSKKKEALAWLNAGIETLEKDLPEISFHAHLSLEAKRAIERLLLWKILRVFVEHDGVLEGNPAVNKAVRDVLAPGTMTPTAENDAMFPTGVGMGVEVTSVSPMHADGADTATMDQIRHHLLKGESEKAVWACVDKRLWGHAMLISQAASLDLYKQVTQEFVRKEVNYPGHQNESLAALYKILSGNYDDCVDELVPVHARAGLQLMSTTAGSGPTRDTLDGLDKWRETLCLVLNNRSLDDIRGLHALGKLLSSYGRAEAAHVCFLFARNASVFGGLGDPSVDFVLLGSDHHQQADQFAKETEALHLSEVYEYGLLLSGGPAAAAGAPHLSAYKLQYAMTLAEYGHRDKALQYCDAIANAISSHPKRSPYHSIAFEAAVEELMARLKQAPKDGSNSWMSKPSMNKVSDSMWNRFNKFVAGDENENGPGAGDGESGPFGRIATTPTISRSGSVTNFEVYGGQSPAYPTSAPQPPATAAASRYAPPTPAASTNPYEPTSQYAPTGRSSLERTSSEYGRNPYEPSYPGANLAPASNGNYAPVSHAPAETVYPSIASLADAPVLSPPAHSTQSTGGYQPYGIPPAASMPVLPTDGASQETETSNQGYQPPVYGYEPPQTNFSPAEPETQEPPADAGSGGYEPPSFQPYGYEPPSYQPDPEAETEEGDDAPKPKKKSFMDDDEDDIPALRPNEKSKAEKDRENQEMFRKAAEEDAKRAAAQQTAKKGWGFSGWWGGGKKAESPSPAESSSPGKPIRAKLGEASSFVYDPDLKRWINKKPGAENTAPKTATPPPPRAGPRSVSGTPPPPMGTPPPPLTTSNSAPPPLMPPKMRSATPELSSKPSTESLMAPPPMMRSASNTSIGGPPSAPPSRPATSMSNASSIDDLLGPAMPRKPGQKKARKSGRYVDVMAK